MRFLDGETRPIEGKQHLQAGDRIWCRKQHWPVVSSGFSANRTKLLFLQGTSQLDTRWLRPDCPRTVRRGQGEEGKCPETMENSNLFQRTKIRVFRRCTHANFRFLNHISLFLKPTTMKRLGIAHSTILDIAMKTQACRNYQERRSILVPAENWREKVQSPQSVCSPFYAAPLSFFLRTWDFITKSRITTWVFPKNCILGTLTELKMWPEIEHLRRGHVPKTKVLALRNTLELSIVSEN